MDISAQRRIVPLVAGMAAMAACLGLAFWCLQILLPAGRQGEPASDGANRAALAVATPYDAEGRRGSPFVVGAGQPVTAGPDQVIELGIRGRHNLRLDPGAQLALNETPQRGCVIALSRGRVRVSIQRAAGEGPCELITPHARVVVLGTVFTVASGLDATRLSVSRGRVRLSTAAGVSQIVAAGQAYRTTGAAVLADGGDPAVADVAVDLLSDPLRALQRSAWYRQRFGCLLHLRDYLAEQDAASDEISLLALSAEPWCLQRPRMPGLPDYQQRKAGLQRAAAAHGCWVEWPRPATREQAEAIVAEALREGSLVLAYGLASEPLRIRRATDLAGQAGEWSYRFLGEAAATPFALCVVSRRGGPGALPSAAASEAIADVRALLAGVADSQYEVGISAIEPASSTRSASEAASHMATMKALTALGRLGPVCQEWLCRQAGSHAPNTGLYSQLDSEVASMFATGAFEETHCVQAQLAESAGRCAATLWGLARTFDAAALD